MVDIALSVLFLVVGGSIGWAVGKRTASFLRRTCPRWLGWLVAATAGTVPAVALLLFFWGIGYTIISRPPGPNETDAGAMGSLLFWILGAILAPSAWLGGLAGAARAWRR